MSHASSRDAFHVLLRIDHELAGKTQGRGCRHCGGSLHFDSWQRKPRGLDFVPTAEDVERLGFSCSTCKLRTTPPSVRFFGRRLYIASLFLVISALKHGKRSRQLCDLLEVDRRTVARWRVWWSDQFTRTAVWNALRGQLRPMSDAPPRGLLEQFGGRTWKAVRACLRALCPLTTATDRSHDP